MSAYDVVLPTPIPDKGAVLTGLSLWWFDQLRDLVPTTWSPPTSRSTRRAAPYADALRGRSMLCRRLTMLPVECVARGYLAGSGLRDYPATGSVCGVAAARRAWSTARSCRSRSSPRRPRPRSASTTRTSSFSDRRGRGRRVRRRASCGGSRSRLRAGAPRSPPSAGIMLADTKLEFGVDGAGVLRSATRS